MIVCYLASYGLFFAGIVSVCGKSEAVIHILTLMLVVANFANAKLRKNGENLLKPGARVLSEIFLMKTRITRLRCPGIDLVYLSTRLSLN